MGKSLYSPRVLIVAENASTRFGGEAALPLHYYRELRQLGVPVWLLVHARTRAELSHDFPGDDHIHFVEDSRVHQRLWRLGAKLPHLVAYMTTDYVSRVVTQRSQRRMARRLVQSEGIEVVHQPIPVSPREPSLLHDIGAPVIIGPMNGGMRFPPAFSRQRGWMERWLYAIGAPGARLLNLVMPGKRKADLLLVANERTRRALPGSAGVRVETLVENGVDLALWTTTPPQGKGRVDPSNATTFMFMGRLIDLKAVDLLLVAFRKASTHAPMALLIVGDGDERARLEAQAREAGILASTAHAESRLPDQGTVRFTGWLSQRECAQWLREADVLVMPSLRECGGAAVLEAMAMAKPVIATAWGGPADYIDSQCGILVPPESPEAVVEGFAQAMVRLASSKEDARRLGEAGRDKVVSAYSWRTKAEAMLEIYRRVAAEASVRRARGTGRSAESS